MATRGDGPRPVRRNRVGQETLGRLLGLESSKIGYYAEVKQKIQELETINLDLRTKKNELQAVFDSIRDGVLVFGPDGRVQHFNHVCPALLQVEALSGTGCRNLFHPDRERAPDACPVERALRGDTCTVSFTTGEGPRTRFFEASAAPILDPFGRPARALVLLRDVTERRLREIQLLQAEKLSSVGLLAAGIAHEINNPLASVGLYAEALQRRFRESPELARDPRLEDFPEYLAVIVREAHRCKAIIESLLSFSRRSDGSMGPVDLGALVREVLQLVGHRAQYEEVEIRTCFPSHLPPVRGDAAALRQVVLNLTLNALQAIEGAGRVDIEARARGDRVALRVRDTGSGIPREHLDQIWAPFFSTKAVGQGLGLGLSVVYNIVMKHGGEVGVESEPGQGSTFTVLLPVDGG